MQKLPEVRHPYSRTRSPAKISGKSLTHQSMADECNINIMMAQYQKTGTIKGTKKQPQYLDLINANDFNDAITEINAANAAFLQLPAEIRKEFNNDPAEFLTALDHGTHDDFLRESGVILNPDPPPKDEPPAESSATPPDDLTT